MVSVTGWVSSIGVVGIGEVAVSLVVFLAGFFFFVAFFLVFLLFLGSATVVSISTSESESGAGVVKGGFRDVGLDRVVVTTEEKDLPGTTGLAGMRAAAGLVLLA